MIKYFCDQCGEEIPYTPPKKYFPYERSLDPSGHGYCIDNVVIEICKKCEVKLFKDFFKAMVKKKEIDKIDFRKVRKLEDCLDISRKLISDNGINIDRFSMGEWMRLNGMGKVC